MIAARGGWLCDVCSKTLPASFQIDHRVPLADGGDDGPLSPNLAALCCDCHGAKTQLENIERARARRVRRRVEPAILTVDQLEERKRRFLTRMPLPTVLPAGVDLSDASPRHCGECGCYYSRYFMHLCRCR